jgi:hypothetical protein
MAGAAGGGGDGRMGLDRAVFQGSRGSINVSLGPTIPYYAMHCGRPRPSWPNDRPGVGCPTPIGLVYCVIPETPGPPMKYGHGAAGAAGGVGGDTRESE